MSKKVLETIIKKLKEEKISFTHLTHNTIPKDSFGAAKVRGTNIKDAAKALILDASSGKKIQAIIPGPKRLDIKTFKQIIEEKNITLSSPDDVLELTGCIVGTVPPMGFMWNIPVFVDESLLHRQEVVFSAGTKNDSIIIKPDELVKINKATVLKISKEI